MMGAEVLVDTANTGLSDEEVVRRVINGERALFEILMRRYNQRLFRVTRSIVTNDLEAEDIIQDAYVRAYEHLSQFEGRARFSTWLTKIAIYEAYARVRRVDYQKVDRISALEGQGMSFAAHDRDPEQQICDGELKMVLEKAFDKLPEDYRSVFMLREVEGMSTADRVPGDQRRERENASASRTRAASSRVLRAGWNEGQSVVSVPRKPLRSNC